MTPSPVTTERTPRFPYAKWNRALPALADQFRENSPFPHIQLTDFLEPEVALAMAQEFPGQATNAWIHYKHHNENKHGLPRRSLFPPHLGKVTDELNSPEFLAWLSQLTGIPELISDPSLEGGGLHQSGRGGFLNVHTDFSMHHFHKHWHRRVNLILYLNVDWEQQWGGAIEFWDLGMRHCVVKYPPLFNHAVIFTTDEKSLHGFPDPLVCPENVSRKSLALYYYTEERDAKVAARSTNYHARPGDGIGRSALIWLDKEAVDLYSRAKARFGFSDDFASKILDFIWRKK
jgi:hypothetical protein